jgi:hypothetical protein
MLGRGVRPIALHRPMPDHAEQSSEDIWSAVVEAVREARTIARRRRRAGGRADRGHLDLPHGTVRRAAAG